MNEIKKRHTEWDFLSLFPTTWFLADRAFRHHSFKDILILISVTLVSGILSWFVAKILDTYVLGDLPVSSDFYKKDSLRGKFDGKWVFSYNLFLILMFILVLSYYAFSDQVLIPRA